jgi:signal transduction histidine kinase
MEDLSLHILDIVENSISASAREVRILITEETADDRLFLEIIDDGKGMDEDTRKKVLDPFFTTRTTRKVGLGLPLLAQAAREGGGNCEIDSAPDLGTRIKAVFQLSHPDRKPLGDIQGTLGTILAGWPEVALVFEYRRDGELVESLDTGRLLREKSV